VNLGDSSDRVRKSSGGTLGAVKLEKDLAADLSAWRDAVKFDLNDRNRSVGGAGGAASLMSVVMTSSHSSGPK
jgi:hypothetical protein